MAFINAYNNETRQKQVIPEHWLSESHPAFKQFTKTPRQKAADKAAPATVKTEPAKPETKEAS